MRLAFLICLVIGCGPSAPRPPVAITPAMLLANPRPQAILLDDTTWTLKGECQPGIFNVGMGAVEYYAPNRPNSRLLVCTDKPGYTGIRILFLSSQTKLDGEWIFNGERFDWYRDGSRSEECYFLGVLDGDQRDWAPDGTLKRHYRWKFGEEIKE